MGIKRRACVMAGIDRNRPYVVTIPVYGIDTCINIYPGGI